MHAPGTESDAQANAPAAAELALRDAPIAQRIRWGAFAGALWGVGLAVVALGFSDARSAGMRNAEVPTFEAPVPLVAMLGFALLVLPLVGAWVGLLLPLARRPWGGLAAGALGALPIVVALALGLPWTSLTSAALKLGTLVAAAAALGGLGALPTQMEGPRVALPRADYEQG